MAHIIINPSLSAAIGYKMFLNPPTFAVVITILEPANSTRTDKGWKYIENSEATKESSGNNN